MIYILLAARFVSVPIDLEGGFPENSKVDYDGDGFLEVGIGAVYNDDGGTDVGKMSIFSACLQSIRFVLPGLSMETSVVGIRLALQIWEVCSKRLISSTKI